MMAQPPPPMPSKDLVGDGGVLKQTLRAGMGARPERGATVEVHYEGTLADTGVVFDSSRARGKTFKFTLGEGRVIGGWEVGVSSMQQGELALLTCKPQYAYGANGIPPTIPPSATLQFEVELISIELPQREAQTMADNNPLVERTPQAIQAAYEAKMGLKEAEKQGLEGFIDWVNSWYIFGLFSTKEEGAPWYLNPGITFPSIFAVVGALFYLTVLLDGLHRGDLAPQGDDLSTFIGDTEPPISAI